MNRRGRKVSGMINALLINRKANIRPDPNCPSPGSQHDHNETLDVALVFNYAPLIKSAARSPIIMQVKLVFAWATVGMIEASATQRFSIPCTASF
jgi:hypothetical protein